LPFSDSHKLVCGHIGKFLFLATGPADVNFIRFGGLSQAKLQFQAVGRAESPSAGHLGGVRRTAHRDRHSGAYAIPITLDPAGANGQPVVGGAAEVVKESIGLPVAVPGTTTGRIDIQIAITVKVGKGLTMALAEITRS